MLLEDAEGITLQAVVFINAGENGALRIVKDFL